MCALLANFLFFTIGKEIKLLTYANEHNFSRKIKLQNVADCFCRRKKRGHLFPALFRRYWLVLSENRTGTEYHKKTINLPPVITQSSSLSLIPITSFDSSPNSSYRSLVFEEVIN